MSYFDLFPRIFYANMANPNAVAQGDFKAVVNIFSRVKFLSSILNNVSLYFNYSVKETDTPEIIAAKYYGDANKHWIVMFCNNIIDPYFQWPMNYEVFQSYITTKYGSVETAQSIVDHYEYQLNVTSTKNFQSSSNTYVSVVSNNVVSVAGTTTFPTINNPVIHIGANTSTLLPDGTIVAQSKQLVAISIYNSEYNTNESYRSIKLVKSDYISQIETELQNLLASSV